MDRNAGPNKLGQQPWTPYSGAGVPADEAPPRDIGGRYMIQQLIGRGGMASVYLGRDRRLKRPIAIKILRRGIEVERFEREAVILADLRHDHIADVHDSGVLDDGRPYFVTEYLEGVNLGRLLAVAPLPWPVVLEIGMQVASALRVVHQRGVIHRDVKPENIVLLRPTRGELRVKLVDFGVARLTTRWDEVARRDTPRKERRRTQEGMALGTDGYISLAASMGQVMPETDVYALGVTLFKLCTGQHPHETDLDGIHQRDIDPQFAQAILRAIDVDPEREIGTAEALHIALTRAAAGHPPERLDQECKAYLGRVFFRDEPAASPGPNAPAGAPTVDPARTPAGPPPVSVDDVLAPPAPARGPMGPSSREELRQWVGRVLDSRFELEAVLGDGGSAVVFDTWDMRFRQRAAVKVLLPEQAGDAAALQRFEHEARVLMKVRHEHLVAAFDRGVTPEGLHYLALEHLDGAHLGKIRGAGWLHWPVVLEIGAQTARALDALHRHGVLHRDVVPSNLVWVRDPRRAVYIKLIDASHCKLLPAWYKREHRDGTRPRDRLVTREGLIFGDRRFRPPEAGLRPPHPREDIFGLGVSLYLLLTGKFPYPAGMPAFGQPTIDAVPLGEANPAASVPAELARLVHDAIQLDPELRPESAEEFFDQWMGAAGSLDANAFHDYVLTGALQLAECDDAQRIPEGVSSPEWYRPRRGARPQPREAAPEVLDARPEPAPVEQVAAPAISGPVQPSCEPPSERRSAVPLRAVFTHVAAAAAAALMAVASQAASPGPVAPTTDLDPPAAAPIPPAAPASPASNVQAAISGPAVARQTDTDRLRDALRAGCPELQGSLRLSVRIDEHRPEVLRVDSMPLDIDSRPEHRCIRDHLAGVRVELRSTATRLFVVKL